MRFRGRSYRALDNKGRLMLPPDFRDILLARMPDAADMPDSADMPDAERIFPHATQENTTLHATHSEISLAHEDRLGARYAKQTKLVLTSYDDCIVGFSLPDWEKLEDAFARLKTHNRLVRDFKRLVIGGAEEVLLDGQGRVRLPQALMNYAGLGKDVVVVGQGDKFEIWDMVRFDAVMAQDFSEVAHELAESGISLSL